MDKPNNSNKITIKINGEKKTYVEESKKIYPEFDEETAPVYTKIEPNPIEQDAIKETAAAQEAVEEEFDWIIPDHDENEIEEFKIVSHNVKAPAAKKTSRNIISGIGPILLSGIFAILIGTTFGILMLKLVITDGSKPAVTTPMTVEKNNEAPKTSDKTVSAVIPAMTAVIVQEGLYTSLKAAQNAANQVKSIGVPAQPIEIGGKNYVYIGIADSGADGKQLGSLYKEKGVIDFFAKQITIEEKKISGITESDKKFLETAPAIYQSLVKLTAGGILTNAPTQEISSQLADQLKSKSLMNEKVKKLNAELSAAAQKAKDAKRLNEAQQHLLNFLALYNSL